MSRQAPIPTFAEQDIEIDVSPPTAAYMTLALLSATYGFEVGAAYHPDPDKTFLMVVDPEMDVALFRIEMDFYVAQLLLAIMTTTGRELEEASEREWKRARRSGGLRY